MAPYSRGEGPQARDQLFSQSPCGEALDLGVQKRRLPRVGRRKTEQNPFPS